MTATFATYNIHRCQGTDRKVDPDRVIRVIEELDADVVALQEVDSGVFVKGGLCQADQVARIPGYEMIRGTTIRSRGKRYGNVLLSKRPVVEHQLVDLGVKFREPRGAIHARLEVGGQVVHVINVHLGLAGLERRLQYRRLSSLVKSANGPVIVMGDFNEWSPLRRAVSPLGIPSEGTKLVRSFPSWRPLLPLDRIYGVPGEAILHVEAHRSELSRVASDHLPVRAQVDFG